MRFLLIAGIAALACGLSAQAYNFSGTVADDQARFILLDVDFGGTAQSIDITVTAQATGGASGLDVDLIDMDELALNGSAAAIESDFDAGTGTITLMMTTPMYSGVHQFVLDIETDGSNGPSP
jgi:hypothetical protein